MDYLASLSTGSFRRPTAPCRLGAQTAQATRRTWSLVLGVAHRGHVARKALNSGVNCRDPWSSSRGFVWTTCQELWSRSLRRARSTSSFRRPETLNSSLSANIGGMLVTPWLRNAVAPSGPPRFSSYRCLVSPAGFRLCKIVKPFGVGPRIPCLLTPGLAQARYRSRPFAGGLFGGWGS